MLRRIPLIVATLLLGLLTPIASATTIVIDAGHGGHDRGGGPGQRIPEKPYTLDVAKRLQGILRANGYSTVMTRSDDTFISLGTRSATANARSDSVFVSIHFNSAPREGADGIETYYYSSRSSKLAAAIHRQVVRAAGTDDRGVRRRGFYVLRHSSRPAVLCELGFLTNRAESGRISGSSSHRQKLADAVARGIMAIY